jgi:hybrid polyketide synthase / nonribosomal peptide synthetase ACE1
LIELGTDQLGVDSLIAVEIRYWFLKEFHIDVNVLKILGGATVGEILDLALEKLPREMTPNLGANVAPRYPPETLPSAKSTSSQLATLGSASSGSRLFDSVNIISDGRDTESTALSCHEPEKHIAHSARPLDLERTEEMSYSQSSFWSLRSLLEDQTTFNVAFSGRLTGPLRVADLEKAILKVGQMHEALRTCFFEDENHQYRQGILPISTIHLERKQITGEEQVAYELKCRSDHVFNLERGETFRILLLSQSSTSNFLIIGYHHVIMDGISLEIFLSDVQKVHNGHPLAPQVLHYCDFSVREREKFRAGETKSELSFWRKEFPDIPPPLPLLPFSEVRLRRNLTRCDYNKVNFKVDPAMALRIKKICKEHKATPFHFYLATFKTLLFRLLGTEEMCIGIAHANRVDNDVLESIGMYLNLLPVRFRAQSKQKFEDALSEARTKAYTAMANGNLSFNILLEELDVPRSATHSPLFQAFVNYRQGVQEKRVFGGCQAEGLDYQFARSPYDLSLDIIDNPGGDSIITLMLQKGLYSVHSANTLTKCFLNLLDEFSINSSIRADSAPLFSPESIQQACELGRGQYPHFYASCGLYSY